MGKTPVEKRRKTQMATSKLRIKEGAHLLPHFVEIPVKFHKIYFEKNDYRISNGI